MRDKRLVVPHPQPTHLQQFFPLLYCLFWVGGWWLVGTVWERNRCIGCGHIFLNLSMAKREYIVGALQEHMHMLQHFYFCFFHDNKQVNLESFMVAPSADSVEEGRSSGKREERGRRRIDDSIAAQRDPRIFDICWSLLPDRYYSGESRRRDILA